MLVIRDVPERSSQIRFRTPFTGRVPLHQETQSAQVRKQYTQNTGDELPAFAFVSVNTTDGKRDWAAESQIRSHAAKRSHAKKRRERIQQFVLANAPTPVEPPVTINPLPECHWHSCGNELRDSPQWYSADSLRYGENNNWGRFMATTEHRQYNRVFGHLYCGECGMAIFHESRDGQVGVRYSSTLLVNPFSQAQLDPFSQTATPITHRMHGLLVHWIFAHHQRSNPRIYGQNNIPKQLVAKELRAVIEDDVACYAISAAAGFKEAEAILKDDSALSSEAVTTAYLRQNEASSFLQQAIKRLNLRLKDHTQSVTIEIIYNVARLAMVSAFAGDLKAHKWHHLGMVKLVELRGGINTIPRYISHHISRMDSMGGWTHEMPPYLPLYEPPSVHQNAPKLQFPNSDIQRFLWEPLFSAAIDINTITRQIESYNYGSEADETPPEKIEVGEWTFAAAQHRLASFPHPEHQTMKSTMYFRQNCWRNAAFIYFNCIIRTTPAKMLLKLSVNRIVECYEKSEPWTGWAPHSNILLWVLLMAMIGAQTEAEKGMFKVEFRRVLHQLQLSTAEEVRQVLKNQLWREQPLMEFLGEFMK